MFVCECGKEFDNPQKFNGHKCHCKEHFLVLYGDLNRYEQIRQRSCQAARKGSQIKKQADDERIKQQAQKWIDEKHTCEKCGKVMTEFYGSGRFCCRACANGKPHSEETKRKISQGTARAVAKAWAEHPESWLESDKTVFHTRARLPKKTCSECGAKLASCNKTGLCKKCLFNTDKGHEALHNIGCKIYENSKQSGKHKPWQSRNVTSYAEKFFINVLNNNWISYKREVPVKHNNSNYFLDFLIETGTKKIDLEIDGKQHKYEDRAKSDVERDKFLSDNGYIVYRIDWNEISSQEGSNMMKQKIDKFLDFYYSI